MLPDSKTLANEILDECEIPVGAQRDNLLNKISTAITNDRRQINTLIQMFMGQFRASIEALLHSKRD